MTDAASYLSKLFLPGEKVCFTDDVRSTQLVTLEAALEMTPRQFVAVNPLHTNRRDTNVSSYRNFLIEFDMLPLDMQYEILESRNVPYTTLTFSGSKSLHAVIALTEPVSKDEYAEIAKLIEIILWQSDPTQKNASRLTRVGGAVRENGSEQTLVDVRKKTSPARLASWLARFETHILESQERARQEAERRQKEFLDKKAAGLEGVETVSDNTREFLEGRISTAKSRHARLVAACFELYECGVEYDEALQLVCKAADLHGITADPRRVREGEQIANYVYSRR